MFQGNPFERLKQLFKQTDLDRYDPERGQAFQRLFVAPTCAIFMAFIVHTGKLPPDTAQFAQVLYGGYLVLAILLFYWIVKRPGIDPSRRILAMLLDYSGIAFSLAIGGEYFLPIFAALVWVTVGYGMRYGVRYLFLATGFALVSIAATTVSSVYWRSHPYVVVTLTLIILMVPAYLQGLLQRLHQAYREALDANTAKSRFLAQASHDLRQPLHAISMFTWCLREENLGSRERNLVEDIDRSLESVSRLFQSLLDVSTLDSGSVTSNPETICVADLFDDIARHNMSAAQWEGVNLRIRRPGIFVKTDPALLATILQNLVGNAIKYAPNNSVLVGCRRHGRTASIVVLDQGQGIAAEHLPHLFDEFYQVKERGSRHVEGVGLGLSIVKRLSKLLGLTVSIRSNLGRGTSVTLSGLEVVSGITKPGVESRSYVSGALAGCKVLLIEDSRDVLHATAMMMQSWGCEVQTELGMPKELGDWDLVVSDYDLGDGMTGGDCILALRRHIPALPALIMTGHDIDRVAAETEQQIPVMAKPVKPSALKKMMLSLTSKNAEQAPFPLTTE